MAFAKRSVKLLLVNWLLSLPLAFLIAVKRDQPDLWTLSEAVLTIFDALGIAIASFVFAILAMFGFRNSPDGGWRSGIITSFIVVTLMFISTFLRAD